MKRIIGAFGVWFASPAGVVQTFGICMAVVGLELAWPRVDPHMFAYLLVLTIYSAITQPVLAYVGMQGARKSDEVLARLEAAEQREIELLEHLAAIRGEDNV